MNKKTAHNPTKRESALATEIGSKAARMLRSKRQPPDGVWFGLGMMGLIGWSVATPTLLGAALGIWLDNHHPAKVSWTLSLLVAGLAIGCFNAWHWVAKEDEAMSRRQDKSDE